MIKIVFFVLLQLLICSANAIPIQVDFTATTNNLHGIPSNPKIATGSFSFETQNFFGQQLQPNYYIFRSNDPSAASMSILAGGLSYDIILRSLYSEGLYYTDSSQITILARDLDSLNQPDFFELHVYNHYNYYNQTSGLHELIYTYMFVTITSDNPDFIIGQNLPTDFSTLGLGNYSGFGFFHIDDKYYEDIPGVPNQLNLLSSLTASGEILINDIIPFNTTGGNGGGTGTEGTTGSIPEPSPLSLLFIGIAGMYLVRTKV